MLFLSVVGYMLHLRDTRGFLEPSISNGEAFPSFLQGYGVDGREKHKTIPKPRRLGNFEKAHDEPVPHYKTIAKAPASTLERGRKIRSTSEFPQILQHPQSREYTTGNYRGKELGIPHQCGTYQKSFFVFFAAKCKRYPISPFHTLFRSQKRHQKAV